MASSQSASLIDAYRDLAVRLRARPNPDIHEVRSMYDELQRVTAEPEGITFTAATADGIPALWCRPDNADERHVMLYIHGGGFQLGSISLYRKLVGHLAVAAGMPALTFDYRLAPEHPYPAQLVDIARVQCWLAEQGVPPQRTIVVGDSAGANLGTVHVLKLVHEKDEGSGVPAGVVATSPWYDLTLSGPSMTARRELDVAVSRSGLLAMRQAYLAGATLPDDPSVSPLYANLTGLPPILIMTGDREILLDDTLCFADRARTAGVPVELGIYPGMPHVFTLLAGRAPEADEATARAGCWARRIIEETTRVQEPQR